MTVADQDTAIASWDEPAGLLARGTLIVVPGRGEQPGVYERLGRRLSADAYRVRVVTDPTADLTLATAEVTGLLGEETTVAPRVLVGSDTGALFAAGLLASGQVTGVDALILAGLPVSDEAAATVSGADPADFENELDSRTTCPTHRARLAGPELRRGALYEPVPDGWDERADLSAVGVPILGLHGAEDPLSPLAAVLPRYAAVPGAELVSITGTRHDALNNMTHRTAAATIVLFLERLRQDGHRAPIAVAELP
jgi:alpha-beta hydrolase superfamily lysophospholipase